jgi:hypothetical protein
LARDSAPAAALDPRAALLDSIKARKDRDL